MRYYTRNDIYDYVARKALLAFPSLYITNRYEPVPPSFPCAMIRQISDNQNKRYCTLDNTSDHKILAYAVDVYSAKAHMANDEAYKIIGEIDSAFRSIGFIRDNIEQFDLSDGTQVRINGRWHRTIGGGDTF